jgi:hypothetical protein
MWILNWFKSVGGQARTEGGRRGSGPLGAFSSLALSRSPREIGRPLTRTAPRFGCPGVRQGEKRAGAGSPLEEATLQSTVWRPGGRHGIGRTAGPTIDGIPRHQRGSNPGIQAALQLYPQRSREIKCT